MTNTKPLWVLKNLLKQIFQLAAITELRIQVVLPLGAYSKVLALLQKILQLMMYIGIDRKDLLRGIYWERWLLKYVR